MNQRFFCVKRMCLSQRIWIKRENVKAKMPDKVGFGCNWKSPWYKDEIWYGFCMKMKDAIA